MSQTVWVIQIQTHYEDWRWNWESGDEESYDRIKTEIKVVSTDDDMVAIVDEHKNLNNVDLDIQKHIIGGPQVAYAYVNYEGELRIEVVEYDKSKWNIVESMSAGVSLLADEPEVNDDTNRYSDWDDDANNLF